MNPKTTELLFAILRSAIGDAPLYEEETSSFSEEILSEVFSLAHIQDLAHLLAVGLDKSGLLTKEQKEKYRVDQLIFQAAYRYEQLNNGYTALCDILEGAGVPFMDLWILEHLDGVGQAERNRREALASQGDLREFTHVVCKLSEIWFGKEVHTPITEQTEQYILCGGVYGSAENRISVQQQRWGGRLNYVLSKFFLPYDSLKVHYPFFENHRWLTPIMEVCRWFKLIFGGKGKKSIKELTYNGNISKTDGQNTKDFLGSIGL